MIVSSTFWRHFYPHRAKNVARLSSSPEKAAGAPKPAAPKKTGTNGD
jgi:hypothetical protein